MNLEEILTGIKAKQISALGRAFTLIESQRKEDEELAFKLLDQLSKTKKQSRRIAITGAPGVGKSSFIEYFGTELIKTGKSLAVLAIDPSSEITGGSLLGDKTRMVELSKSTQAYIRPTPSQNILGGVARRTYEGIKICEAAGFDYIVVETVGVGQSEFEVASMVDQVYLLMQPGLGDDLQGMKRGIVESANGLIINKADQENLPQARRTLMEYKSAIDLIFSADNKPWAHMVSSLERNGFEEVILSIDAFFQINQDKLLEKRKKQEILWFKRVLEDNWKSLLYKKYDQEIAQKKEAIKTSESSVTKALKDLLDQIFN